MIPNISEHEAVEAVVNKYFECVANGDTSLVEKIFHPKATLSGFMVMPGGPEEGVFVLENAADLLTNYMKEAPPLSTTSPNYRGKIISTDIIGRLAVAYIVEEGLEGRDFLNHFQMQKIDGQWYITSKVLLSEPARRQN